MLAHDPELFFYLLVAHALCDTVFQAELSVLKRRDEEPHFWPVYLLTHGFVHGLAVYLLTGSEILFFAEGIAHSVIDFGKCEKWYGTVVDQFLHVLCKLAWAIMLMHHLV